MSLTAGGSDIPRGSDYVATVIRTILTGIGYINPAQFGSLFNQGGSKFGFEMTTYCHEINVNWGETDASGIVYFPCILAWFNDAEHQFFHKIGYPIDGIIRDYRAAFVMGDVHFRFTSPAAFGDRISCRIKLKQLRNRTLQWDCKGINSETGAVVTEGQIIRVYSQFDDDGSLRSAQIPDAMRLAIIEAAAEPIPAPTRSRDSPKR